MTQNGGARCIVARVTGEAHRALLAWRNAVDLQIIQAQLDRSGRALVIWFGETHGFAQITALPRPGEARPHYGSFGGGYEYCFLHGPAGWMLQVENYAQGSVRFGLATPIPPLLLDDPTAVRVDALPTPPEGVSWSYPRGLIDRKSTRLNSSHVKISYAVFCLKKKKQ